MNNPAASGLGIKTDLLVGEKPTAQGFKIPQQASGEFTPTRLKEAKKQNLNNLLIMEDDLSFTRFFINK